MLQPVTTCYNFHQLPTAAFVKAAISKEVKELAEVTSLGDEANESKDVALWTSESISVRVV